MGIIKGDLNMSKIVFFSLPAYGHTNPTIEVVRELVNDGNEVVYYSFNEFKDRIEKYLMQAKEVRLK